MVLRNGMRVCIYSYPQLESVGVAVGVNYGSVDDREAINGAAHFVEHMLFDGTRNRSSNQMEEAVRGMGANWDAFTTFENTVYYLQGYRGYFERMVELLSDMIKNSTFPKKQFVLERGPIINENLISQDNADGFFTDNFTRALYEKHPARLPVGGGTKEGIERIKRGDLVRIYQKYYTPRNMVLVIYGNIRIGKAKEASLRYFGDFRRKYVPKRRKVAREAQVRREIVVHKENLRHAIIGIGFKCAEFKASRAKEFAAMLVISKILQYRLFDEVRDKRGLSYDPGAAYYAYSTFAFIAAQAGTEPSNISETKRIMLRELQKLQEGRISRREVKNAREELSIQYRVLRDDTLEMANAVASYTLVTGDYKFVERLPALLKAVSLEAVKRYCRRYIRANRYGLLVLRPE
jgi:predicted Zn-dependent peptidase